MTDSTLHQLADAARRTCACEEEDPIGAPRGVLSALILYVVVLAAVVAAAWVVAGPPPIFNWIK